MLISKIIPTDQLCFKVVNTFVEIINRMDCDIEPSVKFQGFPTHD